MITQTILMTALRSWILTAVGSGIEVFWKNQNAPKPPAPCIALSLGLCEALGTEEKARPDSSGDTTIKGHRSIAFVVDVFTATDTGIMLQDKIYMSTFVESFKSALYAYGIAVSNRISCLNLPVLSEITYHFHTVAEYIVYYSIGLGIVSEGDTAINEGWIEHVIVTDTKGKNTQIN